MDWIVTVLVVFVPIYVAYRLSINGAVSLYNFCLYPLVFAYFYLLIPALIPFASNVGDSLMLSQDSFLFVDQLSVWYVFVFLFSYLLSSELKGQFNRGVRLSKISVLISKVTQVCVLVIMLVIFFKHGAALISISGDRGLSYDYYAREIIDVYKLPVLWSFTVISSTILYIHYKRWYFFAIVFFFALLDTLQGGRGYTFAAISVVGLNYLALNMGSFRRVLFISIFVLGIVFASAFVRRFLLMGDTSDPLVIFFGEFFFTRLTAQITYDNLASSGALTTYLLVAASKMFPQFIVAPFFGEGDLIPYHVLVNDWADAGFGLAGSLMSEAIYYGGDVFAVISPVMISSLFLLLSRLQVARSFVGYLFFLVMVSSMYLIFRTGFYTIFFSTIYMFAFYFSIIIYPSIRTRLFVSSRQIY